MTDEVRQEAREAVEALGWEWTDCPTERNELVQAFARHASPLRDRIAVLEGALDKLIAAADAMAWAANCGMCEEAIAEARAALNGEKKDGR